LELASLFNSKPVIAVTGSNGKSTTSILIDEMLKAEGKKVLLGGNFGTPFSELLLSETPADMYVLEVSSFQLERIQHFSPQVSVLTNLSPNHLDRYSSYEEYCLEKAKIFAAQEKTGWGILRQKEYLFLKKLGVSFPNNVILTDAKDEWTQAPFVDEESLKKICAPSERVLKGKHNLENILAAANAVTPFGVGAASIRKVLTQFKGLAHRIEKVLSLDGVDYINDSKSTSVDAVQTALHCFDSILWIAGGRNKGSDFSSLVPQVEKKVRAAFFIGESQELLAQTFGAHVRVNVAPSLEEAVFKAKEEARSGDVVLFSPGCSSFDMFHDFEHRGNCFKRILKNLKK
jgi:UDP-N-acetylmuramoylalanine--D-glutamate ligase